MCGMHESSICMYIYTYILTDRDLGKNFLRSYCKRSSPHSIICKQMSVSVLLPVLEDMHQILQISLMQISEIPPNFQAQHGCWNLPSSLIPHKCVSIFIPTLKNDGRQFESCATNTSLSVPSDSITLR